MWALDWAFPAPVSGACSHPRDRCLDGKRTQPMGRSPPHNNVDPQGGSPVPRNNPSWATTAERSVESASSVLRMIWAYERERPNEAARPDRVHIASSEGSRSDATACTRKTRSRRIRAEPCIQRRPSRLGSAGSGSGSFTSDKPSGQGGDQSGTSETPKRRSTMTAMASKVDSTKRSRGRMPARAR